MDKFKLALVQAQWELGNVDANVKKAEEKVREACGKGADLVCLPEGFNTGYYCAGYETMKECAESLDGTTVRKMRSLARELQVYLMAPIMMQVGTGLVENTAVLIDDGGEIIGTYSKTHLVGAEQMHLHKGRNFPVFHTKFGKIGIVICYDICFPETTRILAVQGADLILCPSAWRGGSYFVDWFNRVTEVRALDNNVFVAHVNHVGGPPDAPFCGSSQVIDPIGQVLVRASEDREEMVYQDIDMTRVQKERMGNTVMIDRRPELYRLLSER